jgi:hypothetical protein
VSTPSRRRTELADPLLGGEKCITSDQRLPAWPYLEGDDAIRSEVGRWEPEAREAVARALAEVA